MNQGGTSDTWEWSFEWHMEQVAIWAEEYDRKAIRMTPEEYDALYNDAFFEAIALAEKLP